jgi:hypothetical protein
MPTSPPLACSFALGRGRYCHGDVHQPSSHDVRCPGYRSRDDLENLRLATHAHMRRLYL